MSTLNQQLRTIESFNNTAISEVSHQRFGHVVKIEATVFAAKGIESELNLKLNRAGSSNKYMFVSTLPNVAE